MCRTRRSCASPRRRSALPDRSRVLLEEVAERGGYQVRRFFRQEVTGGQGLAADVAGVLPPDAERLVFAADETLRPPQHQDRAFELLPGGKALVVVDEIDARRRTVVGARARDRPGVAEAADVVRHRGDVDARALAEERADDGTDPVAGVRADQALGDATPDREEEPVVIRRGHGPRHVTQDMPGS